MNNKRLVKTKLFITFLSIMITIMFTSSGCAAKRKNVKVVYSGKSSWYGGREKLNKYTATGERFNPRALTCATYYYPAGARLKVTNVENGKSVVVRVNDLGPNKRLGRLIDLTRRAFSKIADTRKGLVTVMVEEVKKAEL